MNRSLWILCALLLALQFMACNEGSETQNDSVEMVNTGNPTIDGISLKIKQNPTDASLYAARAEAFYEIDGYDEAIADLADALKLDSINADYHHLLADVYLDYFKSREAITTMERAAQLHPQRIPTLLKLSEFQLILKKHEQSLATADRVLKIDPNNAEAYVMIGLNFETTGDTARAINSYQIAVEKDPDLADIWVKMGQLFAAQNNPIAPRYFENAIEAAPNAIEPLYAKAEYLHLNNKQREALPLLQQITRREPQFVEAYFRMGVIYLEIDSIDQAYKHFDLAINVDPALAKAYYYRALTSQLKGDLANAKNDYQQTLNLDPKFTRAQQALDKLAQ